MRPILLYREVHTCLQVELGASKSDAAAAVCCMLDPELHYQEEDDTRSLRKAAAGQTLALSAGTELQVRVICYATPVESALNFQPPQKPLCPEHP